MAPVQRRGDVGEDRIDPDARADQPARAGTADRRVVFEVGVAPISPQLVRPAAGGWWINTQVWRPGLPARWRKDITCCGKVFSDPSVSNSSVRRSPIDSAASTRSRSS